MRVSNSLLLSIIKGTAAPWISLLDRTLLAKPSDLEPIELQYLRARTGWSEADLAQALGVSSNVTVSRWESGTRRIPRPTERLFRVLAASVLGVESLRSLAQQFRSSWRHVRGRLEVHLYPERNGFEYRWASIPKKLPRPMHRLFWDTDPTRLNLERQADYIITRLLEKGDLAEWNWLRWTYGEPRIGATLKRRRGLSPATVQLWRNGLLGHMGGN